VNGTSRWRRVIVAIFVKRVRSSTFKYWGASQNPLLITINSSSKIRSWPKQESEMIKNVIRNWTLETED
jgi:hypothetical protein